MSDTLYKAEQEIQTVLEKYGVSIGYQLDFPMYKILPKDIQLALEILGKANMKILFKLEDKNKS